MRQSLRVILASVCVIAGAHISEAQSGNANQAKTMFYEAAALYENGNAQGALQALERLQAALGKTNARILALETKIHFKLGNTAQAREAAYKLKKRQPRRAIMREMSTVLSALEARENEKINASLRKRENAQKRRLIGNPISSSEIRDHLTYTAPRGDSGRDRGCCRYPNDRSYPPHGDDGEDSRRSIQLFIVQKREFDAAKPIGTVYSFGRNGVYQLGDWDFANTLNIKNRGGNGGRGAQGAQGGNGRTGVVSPYNGRYIVAPFEAQPGGNGDSGGDGGDGGDGGQVDIIIAGSQSFFSEVSKSLRVDVSGGAAGSAGPGGFGGYGGLYPNSNYRKPQGRNGYSGSDGARGRKGSVNTRFARSGEFQSRILEPLARLKKQKADALRKENEIKAEQAELQSLRAAYPLTQEFIRFANARGSNGVDGYEGDNGADGGNGAPRTVFISKVKSFSHLPSVYRIDVVNPESRAFQTAHISGPDDRVLIDTSGGSGGTSHVKKRTFRRDRGGQGGRGGACGDVFVFYRSDSLERASGSWMLGTPNSFSLNVTDQDLVSSLKFKTGPGNGGANSGKFSKNAALAETGGGCSAEGQGLHSEAFLERFVQMTTDNLDDALVRYDQACRAGDQNGCYLMETHGFTEDGGIIFFDPEPAEETTAQAIQPSSTESVAATTTSNSAATKPTLGVEFSLHGSGRILITHVLPGSIAEEAGLAVADFVDAIDGQALTTPDQFKSIISGAKAGDLRMFTIERGGVAQFIAVRFGG